MAQLVVKFRDGTLKELDLRSVLSIGRQSTNDLQLPEELASRQHARIIPSGRTFIVEDLRSANGTFVNGQQIQRRVLANGDLIRIGGCELVFKDDAAKDLVGELIADRYRVLGKLGSGGMGTVYKALQISMDRQVALKVLNPELTRDREFVVGFLNEARTAGQLNHPNIIQVHDFGEWKGFYYFSMEMVEGENVLAILKREGKISPQRALTMAGELCEGLTHAHAHNIVHQDIKPQNLMIDRRHHDVVKLADLGLAKVIGHDKGQRRGVLMGTPHYMAPEQARGVPVDGRTDIYAAGATLFHMLTGRVPYDGKNSIEILTKHVKNDVPDPRQYDVSIPESVARLCMSMMAKEPARRPQSAKAIGERIEEILATESVRFQRAAAPRPATAARAVPRKQLRRVVRGRRGRAGVLPWIIVLLFVVALTVLWIVLPGDGKNGAGNGSASGLTQQQIGKLFERARIHREAGNFREAEKVLRRIFREAPGTADGKRASAMLVQIGKLRKARGEYAELERFMRRYPKALKTARQQLKGFIANYSSVPQTRHARRELERVERALRAAPPVNGSNGKLGREAEAREAYKTAQARAETLAGRQEFFAAERSLLDFAATFTATGAAGAARKRADEFRRLGDQYLGGLLGKAQGYTKAKRYRPATELYSQIISRDPGGKWGKQARAALTAQDAATKAAFDAGWAKAMAAFKEFKFLPCSRLADRTAQELVSTRWQSKLDRLAADAVRAARLHAAMLKKIENHGQAMPCPFRVPDPGGGSHFGRIVGVNRDAGGVNVKGGPATIVVKWKAMKPGEMAKVYLAYKVPAEHHLAAGCLFAYHGLKPQALAEFRRARAVKASRDEAGRRIAELEGRANLLSYTFTGGLEMLDWHAASGSWGLKAGKLAGGGAGESVIRLKKTRYSARDLVLSFEFKLSGGGSVITAELYGSDNDYLGVIVDPRGKVSLVSRVDGTPLTSSAAKKLATGTQHIVKLTVSGGRLEVTADGQKLPALAVPRIETISGNLRFKVLDGQAAIDNVEIRNSAE